MWSTPPRVARCNGLHHPHWEEPKMKFAHSVVAAAVSLGFCTAAFAQAGTVQRDVNQQQRIEQGLQSGQLNSGEASRLEREQSRIDRDQARALKDGKLSPAEKARLQREQN